MMSKAVIKFITDRTCSKFFFHVLGKRDYLAHTSRKLERTNADKVEPNDVLNK